MAPSTVAPTENPNPRGYVGAYDMLANPRDFSELFSWSIYLARDIDIGSNTTPTNTTKEHQKADGSSSFRGVCDIRARPCTNLDLSNNQSSVRCQASTLGLTIGACAEYPAAAKNIAK
jgi:hypothetical protein